MALELQNRVCELVQAVHGGSAGSSPEWLNRPGNAECGRRWPAVRRIYQALTALELLDQMPPRERLPYLEPAWRAQLAHAVGHVGLIGALRSVTGTRAPNQLRGVDESAHGVSFTWVSENRPAKPASRSDRERELWARNERIRVADLRADAERPMGELLEEGIELSRFASELAAAPRREP